MYTQYSEYKFWFLIEFSYISLAKDIDKPRVCFYVCGRRIWELLQLIHVIREAEVLLGNYYCPSLHL